MARKGCPGRKTYSGCLRKAMMELLPADAAAGRSFNFETAMAQLKPDRYQRRGSKKARHWPHHKRPKAPGAPKARNATESDMLLARELEELEPAA